MNCLFEKKNEICILDKKLEASREEFQGLVDCVLATNELPSLFENKQITSFVDLEEADMLGNIKIILFFYFFIF